MTGLDTNVLVRYLVQDDAEQAASATRLIEACSRESPGYVGHIVLCELVWVLEDCYHQAKPAILGVLEKVLSVAQLEVESPALVWLALEDYREGSADFSDHLLARANLGSGCADTVTFDRKAGRSPGFRLL